MNQEYVITMVVSGLVSLAFLLVRLKKWKMKLAPGIVGAVLAVFLGWAMAKLFYVALLFSRVWPRFGWGAFLRFRGPEFCFIGGCVGVSLAMALSARLFKENVRRFMSAFAPCGALMVAGSRYAERYLGLLGAGRLVDDPALQRFPIAISNEWNEWFLAIFMLEAVLALIIAVIFTVRKKENVIAGLRMERTSFYLFLTQVFCESLRAQGMRWGFVRVEQVLCAVFLVGLLIYACLRTKEQSFLKRFWPVGVSLVIIGMIIGVEFALDKTDLSPVFWYAVMIAALAGFGSLEWFCSSRRIKQAQG